MIDSYDWSLPERLRVRMGIHTGAATERGGDYFGPTLNEAARLMSAAHGRQIVLSPRLVELVVYRSSPDRFEELTKAVGPLLVEELDRWR